MFLHALEIAEVFILVISLLIYIFSDRFRRRFEILMLSSASIVIYLIWRMCFTIPTNSWPLRIMGIILVATEIIGFLDTIPFYMLIWSFKRQSPPPIRPDFCWPSVDIYIATYNEPTSLLYKTVYACSKLQYPDPSLVRIYICDDGNRKEVAELAKSLGVEYIGRTSNKGAKAGNLNNALKLTSGQLIVTFDADMIPNSQFLLKTVPFMQDIDIGFVQTPQGFYNQDLFQYNTFLSDILPNEQDFFTHVIQTGRAYFNSVIYSGSNTMFRRRALEDVGGFLEGTITEDFATGMKIQAKGWKSKYLDEVLAVGLSPETFEDLINQRIRWGRGVIQTFKRYNPLRTKGLSLSQKLLYLNAFTYWFFGIYKHIYFTAPLLYGAFGLVIFRSDPLSLLSVWLLQFIVTRLAFNAIVGRYSTSFWRNAFDTAIFPHISWAVTKELLLHRKDVSFKVTPKERVKKNKMVFKYSLVMVQLVYLVLSLISVVHVGFYIDRDIVQWHTLYVTNDVVALFWLIYNMAQIFVAIVIANERPRLRGLDRFSIKSSATIMRGFGLPDVACQLENISETGLAIRLEQPYIFPSDQTVTVRIGTNYLHHVQDDVEVTCSLVLYETGRTGYKAAFKFVDIDEKTYQRLLTFLYDRHDIVPYRDDFSVRYIPFLMNYVKSRYRSTHGILLSRKSPRIELPVEKRGQRGLEFLYYTPDGDSVSMKALNVNHSHVLIQAESSPSNLRVVTLLEDKEYKMNLILEQELRPGIYLYKMSDYNLQQIEDWIIAITMTLSRYRNNRHLKPTNKVFAVRS